MLLYMKIVDLYCVEDSYSSMEQATATLQCHKDKFSNLRRKRLHLIRPVVSFVSYVCAFSSSRNDILDILDHVTLGVFNAV